MPDDKTERGPFDNGLVGDSIMVSGRGIEHADCRYMAVLFAGIEVPDQRIWFCNKCGNGGVLNETQTAIAEVLALTAHRLRDDANGG
jgi:hypothetical protein